MTLVGRNLLPERPPISDTGFNGNRVTNLTADVEEGERGAPSRCVAERKRGLDVYQVHLNVTPQASHSELLRQVEAERLRSCPRSRPASTFKHPSSSDFPLALQAYTYIYSLRLYR